MGRITISIVCILWGAGCISGSWQPDGSEFGAGCFAGPSCQSGYCFAGRDRWFCTRPCTSSAECGAGYVCALSGFCDTAPIPVRDAGIDTMDAGPPILDLSFDPSNIGSLANGRPHGSAGPLNASCYFDTDSGATNCMRPGSFFYVSADVDDDEFGLGRSARLAVFVGESLHVPIAERMSVRGTWPLVVVVQGDIRIDGEVVAGEGFQPEERGGVGGGPGGGGIQNINHGSGAEGAAYCTVGARGARMTSSFASPYGDDAITGLLPGSAGGANMGIGNNQGGAGGGSIQLVAGGTLVVSVTGSILANGHGGNGARGDGGGGGSGGSILLEAPEVEIAGTLNANGGRGGITIEGAVAEGARDGHTPPSFAQEEFQRYQGGGGGFGRIRVNSGNAVWATSSTLSPDLTTGCTTFGSLGALTPATPPVACAAVMGAPSETCEECVALHCCPRAEACASDPVCLHCTTNPNGSTCQENDPLRYYAYCASQWCSPACGTAFLQR